MPEKSGHGSSAAALAQKPESARATPAQTGTVPLIVVGAVRKTSVVPKPYSVPYGDCLTLIQLRLEKVESGTYHDAEMTAVFWAMKNNVWLPAAKYAPGDRVRLRLILFKDADSRTRSVQRTDDLDDYRHVPYFVLSEERL
jgi:hypothetical protein